MGKRQHSLQSVSQSVDPTNTKMDSDRLWITVTLEFCQMQGNWQGHVCLHCNAYIFKDALKILLLLFKLKRDILYADFLDIIVERLLYYKMLKNGTRWSFFDLAVNSFTSQLLTIDI